MVFMVLKSQYSNKQDPAYDPINPVEDIKYPMDLTAKTTKLKQAVTTK